MPYPGKPSRGCHTCRRRKVKCDETKPVCTRCSSTNRDCGGYRSEAELIFRDQNAVVERKNAALCAKAAMKKAAQRGCRGGGTQVVPAASAAALVQKTLEISVDQRSVCRFLYDYVMQESVPETGGYLDYLPVMYARAAPGSCFRVAMTAAALAHLGNREENPRARVDAQAAYTCALKLMNAELKTVGGAGIQDETMVAINVLALYETVTCTHGTIAGWYSHVSGSVALMRARGPQWLETEVGPKVFAHHRMQWLISSCQRGSLVFEGAEQWQFPDSRFDAFGRSDPKNRLFDIMVHIPKLIGLCWSLQCFSNKETLLDDIVDLEERTGYVDSLMEMWRNTLPDAWEFEVVDSGGVSTPGVYHGMAHLYSDPLTASIWSYYRAGRIITQSILRNCKTLYVQHQQQADDDDDDDDDSTANLQYADPESSIEQHNRAIQQLIDELCASAPFALGHNFPGRPSSGFCASEERGCRALGASLYAWPLYVGSVVPFISSEQRRWILQTLELSADYIGFRLASYLAGKLGRKGHSRPILVLEPVLIG